MKKKKYFCLFSFFLSFFVVAIFITKGQLYNFIVSIFKQRADALEVESLNKIAYAAVDSDSELCEKASSALYALSKKRNYHKGIGYYYFNVGERNFRRVNLEASVDKLSKSTAIFKETKIEIILDWLNVRGHRWLCYNVKRKD